MKCVDCRRIFKQGIVHKIPVKTAVQLFFYQQAEVILSEGGEGKLDSISYTVYDMDKDWILVRERSG